MSDSDPIDCSTPGLPVSHYILEFAQVCVHWVGDAIQLSCPLSSPSHPAFYLSSIRVFSNESALCLRWPKYWSFSSNFVFLIHFLNFNFIYLFWSFHSYDFLWAENWIVAESFAFLFNIENYFQVRFVVPVFIDLLCHHLGSLFHSRIVWNLNCSLYAALREVLWEASVFRWVLAWC